MRRESCHHRQNQSNHTHAPLFEGRAGGRFGALDGNESEAGTINSHGQIAGNYLNLVPDLYSFIDRLIFGPSNGTQARGFFWQNGTAQDIGTLGGESMRKKRNPPPDEKKE